MNKYIKIINYSIIFHFFGIEMNKIAVIMILFLIYCK